MPNSVRCGAVREQTALSSLCSPRTRPARFRPAPMTSEPPAPAIGRLTIPGCTRGNSGGVDTEALLEWAPAREAEMATVGYCTGWSSIYRGRESGPSTHKHHPCQR
ncbi:hypothetical protein AOLI_G00032200 [Acnodon oligacanthus]